MADVSYAGRNTLTALWQKVKSLVSDSVSGVLKLGSEGTIEVNGEQPEFVGVSLDGGDIVPGAQVGAGFRVDQSGGRVSIGAGDIEIVHSFQDAGRLYIGSRPIDGVVLDMDSEIHGTTTVPTTAAVANYVMSNNSSGIKISSINEVSPITFHYLDINGSWTTCNVNTTMGLKLYQVNINIQDSFIITKFVGKVYVIEAPANHKIKTNYGNPYFVCEEKFSNIGDYCLGSGSCGDSSFAGSGYNFMYGASNGYTSISIKPNATIDDNSPGAGSWFHFI